MNTNRSWKFFLSLLPLFLFPLSGCSSNGPELAAVRGRVTLDGKPLAGATLTFQPRAGGRSSTAVTDEQGEYELTFIGAVQGVIPGEQDVIIKKYQMPPGGRDEVLIIPQRYTRPGALTADVRFGEASEIHFDLKSK